MREPINITIELGGEILKQSLEHSENLGITLEEYVKKVTILSTLLISSKTLNLDPFEYINPKQ